MSIEHRVASPDPDYSGLEGAHPREVIEWAARSIDRLAIATSFQSSGMVLLHMLKDIRPDIPVLFIDTGFHFPETLEFRTKVVALWDLKLVDLRGRHGSVEGQEREHGPHLFDRNPGLCCHINKVEPLQDALEEFDGWLSGLRRDQSPLRSVTPIVEAQMLPSGDEIVKVHPLAGWSSKDVLTYVRDNDIPTHPLFAKGFASIGCYPCTRAVGPDEDERAGRWDGQGKSECGIHTFGKTGGPIETEAEQ